MRIKINGSHDLDSAELVLQQVMAFLQDHHVSELDRINIYVTPKRKNGEDMDFAAKKTPAFEIIPDAPKSKGRAGKRISRPR